MMKFTDWVLLKIFGGLPILVGVSFAIREKHYSEALGLWGIYILLSYIVWKLHHKE